MMQQTTKLPARQAEIKEIVRSQLSLSQISTLRDRYMTGKETIAELAQMSWCPPVLLYVILTPIAEQTSYKLRILREETNIRGLHNQGLDKKQISVKLRISEETVYENTDGMFSDEMFRLRPWYHEKISLREEQEYQFPEALLPPVSHSSRNGPIEIVYDRCPRCGCKVVLPCMACMVRDVVENKLVPLAGEVEDNPSEIPAFQRELLFS